ncbi:MULTISPECIES: hypothetical protein [Comamonas]|uniref:Uncharacterized protein n=1 Tax=Comamonas testosteroni TaxID=285 RepID=A0A096FMH1_COMTE|nr:MULTISPECIES: hypothetical protein [Comamonas]KGH31074.1 hypothetical protein P353_07075 [Comamonas testosteroni]MPT11553.1 hypothetical protein [Comamonas sp.]
MEIILKYGRTPITQTLKMKTFLLAISTVAFFDVAQAMSFSVAVQKIQVFELARHSSAYCEKQGMPTNQSYVNWLTKSGTHFSEALSAVEKEVGKQAVSKDDQIVARAIIVKEISKSAQEYLSKKGVDCAMFDSILLTYSRFLKQ